MVEPFTMEGPLTKWTNLVHGWQYRWFVLDVSVGILFYYTSKEKMKRGDRRGSVKLKNALVGIDDLDDSTFTITADHKTFHFRARDSDERQKWLDALQEVRDLHTHHYALLHQTKKLLDDAGTPTEFDRRIVEVDAYLQILIEQQQELSNQATDDECPPEVVSTVNDRLQSLIELVKKTLVCLQFAREFVSVSYSTVLSVNTPSSNQLACSEPQYLTSAPSCRGAYPSSSIAPAEAAAAADTCHRKSPKVASRRPSQASNPPRAGGQDRVALPQSALDPPLHPVGHPAAGTAQNSSVLSLPVLPQGNSADQTGSAPTRLVGDMPPTVRAEGQMRSNGYWDYGEDDVDVDDDDGDEDDDEFFDTHEEIGQQPSLMNEYDPSSGPLGTASATSATAPRELSQMSTNNQSPGASSARMVAGGAAGWSGISSSAFSLSPEDMHDELYDNNEEEELSSENSHGSVITHLLRQLRIGMDLTRITLPTFILERRSTLEMYGDFMAHADLWAAIPNARTARDRMVACLRWYLSAFHAGRRSSVAKKPYNPILGEVFKCFWSLPAASCEQTAHHCHPTRQSLDTAIGQSAEDLLKSSPVPWAPRNSVTFIAEQVSHHPPISAFYGEHVDQRICMDGYLWTRSKYLGLSIGVEMVGEAVISLLALDEEYTVTFPWGYGRSILSVPWIELGGKTSIICPKTGYSTQVEFKTKPFYGGKKNLIRAESFAPNGKKPFLVVEGEWNSRMWAHWADGKEELFFDTGATEILTKYVLPRSYQSENESRRLWEQVTSNLKLGNIDAASSAKFRLEQAQREAEQLRKSSKTTWVPVHFRGEGDAWVYRHPLIQRAEPALSS